MRSKLTILLVTSLLAASCAAPASPVEPSRGPDQGALRLAVEAVRPLHTALGPPEPGDWLATYPEPRQTFEEYLKTDPVTARGPRRVLYVQPIGDFTPGQRRVLDLTAEFLGHYFGLPVRTLAPIQLGDVPADFRRERPDLGVEQVLAGYIMASLLRPRLPDDAAACIGLTAVDLWPGEDWNYVFGQATTRDRVGVWSLHRLGDPEGGRERFRTCLLRMLKIASHETGHMFSIPHCAIYECGMGGTMSLPETDRHPLELCAECMAKVCWATGAGPVSRLRLLAEFCARNELLAERLFYERSLAELSNRNGGPAILPPADPATRAAIEHVNASRATAAAAHDPHAYLASIAPGFSLRLRNGLEVDRAALAPMLAHSWSADPSLESYTIAVEAIVTSGDEAVVDTRHDFARELAKFTTRYRETWVRSPDGWLLARAEELP